MQTIRHSLRRVREFLGTHTTPILSIVALVALLLAIAPRTAVGQAFYEDFFFRVTGKLLFSSATPTLTGFGNTPGVIVSNGVVAFKINVGTGGSAWNGVVVLPAATTGWNCYFTNQTNGTDRALQTGTGGTTSVTVWNYGTGTTTQAWVTASVLQAHCEAF